MNFPDNAESTSMLSLFSIWPTNQISSDNVMALNRKKITYSHWAHCLSRSEWCTSYWVEHVTAWGWSQALSGLCSMKVGQIKVLWGHGRQHTRENMREIKAKQMKDQLTTLLHLIKIKSTKGYKSEQMIFGNILVQWICDESWKQLILKAWVCWIY